LFAGFSAILSVGLTPKVKRHDPRFHAASSAVFDFWRTFWRILRCYASARPAVGRKQV
jgi:hypothetical protein